MLSIAFANLWARKLRLVSTSISVVIGVAFLAGSMVLLDTIGRTFDDLFVTINEGTDAHVRAAEAIESSFADLRGRIDEDLVDLVRSVEGVEAAEASVEGFAQLVGPDGEPLGNPGQGAPTLGFNWGEVDALNPMRLVEGRAPRGPDEMVIDKGSADAGPFAVGDRVTVLSQGPPREFTVVGIATFGSADSALGATMAMFELATAQEILAEPGRVNSIGVVADEGVSQQELVERLRVELPDEVEVLTGAELTEEQQSDVADALGFFNTFLLVFALIALFVAAFIIFNTFSILTAQRTREMGLLRALGAGRLQILGSVLLEAVVVGLVASAVGIGAGVGVAGLLKGLLAATGLAIPAGGTVLEPSTVWMSILVGLVVTVLSAALPARRAAAIAPMEALRDTVSQDGTGAGRRLAIGLVGLAAGLVLLAWGLLGGGSNAALLVGLGAAVVFLGVAALGPFLAVPVGRLLGRPVARLGGVPGELAAENVVRNPHRTATTAAALMIGVGLVGAISVFADSTKASIDRIIDDSFIGDLVIDSGTFGLGGLSPDLAARLNELPEVEAASGVRLAFAEVAGATRTLFAVDPQTMGDIVDVGVIQGEIRDLDADDLAVHDEFAADQGWEVGDTVEVRFAETGAQSFDVALLYEVDDLTGNFFIANSALEANVPDVFDFQVYVLSDPDVPAEQVRAAVEAVAADFPNAEVQDLEEFKQAQSDQIDQLLNLVYALLGLAIVIALIGIANTLALSIFERTRELGLLRAVGMTRTQLKRSIRAESVIIAVFGTLLGVAVGLGFGWAIVSALADEGITELRVPVGQLVMVVVVAVLAGVIASLRPARRAARLNVLEAIAAE